MLKNITREKKKNARRNKKEDCNTGLPQSGKTFFFHGQGTVRQFNLHQVREILNSTFKSVKS